MCDFCERIKSAKWKKSMFDRDMVNWQMGERTTSPAYSFEDIAFYNQAIEYNFCPKCGKPL